MMRLCDFINESFTISGVVAVLLIALSVNARAQSNAGAIRGVVTDQTGAVVAGATVRLTSSITNYLQETSTDNLGAYHLVDIPFNRYLLAVEARGLQTATRELAVRSNLLQQADIQLAVETIRQQVNVSAAGDLIDPEKTGPSIVVDRNRILQFATAQPSNSAEEIIATAPGWTLNANGRLHARGNEYQVQYSIDGIPVIDTIASTFASAPDPRNFRSVEVITGNIPAEYGSKLAGVIAVNSRSGFEGPQTVTATIAGGSFSSVEVSFDFSGKAGKLGYLVSAAGSATDRFLDPPSFENLHNHGRGVKSFFKLDYAASENDLFRFNLFIDGAQLQIPNLEAQEIAGQDQRRRLRADMQSLSWQHVFSKETVSQVALFRRRTSSRLESNELVTPVFAEQFRQHSTYGVMGSLTREVKRNTIKAGMEITRFPVSESFTFAITDLASLLETVPDLTEEARRFTPVRPFLFDERRAGAQAALYFQDHIKATKDLVLNVGARFDSYHFLVEGSFISPRVGAAYHIRKSGTVLRASVDRLIETPALENLLLSSSEKTRLFSPAARTDQDDKEATGVEIRGAPVPLGRAWQYDVGFQQQLSRYVRLDADFYYRRSKNNAEIINFIETEIAFPATLARSASKGVEARLDLAQTRGFSAFVSYTNLNIYGIAPITGGLFLGEAVDLREQQGRRIKNEEDQRNTVVFELRYEHERSRLWAAFGGRHDSGYAVELEDDSSPEDFERRFPAKILREVNLERGFIRPHTVLNLSVGKDFSVSDHANISAQLNFQNLTDKFYLFTFGSLFTGTNIGQPRSYSGRLSFNFK
jgi:outer membrane receptor protein involved in Fe transport